MAIFGYFIFTDLGDGCLASKYSNTDNKRVFSETALLIEERSSSEPFVGEYEALWFNYPDDYEHSKLSISRKDGSNSQYNLIWKSSENKILYSGEGMCYNGILSGAYWDSAI